MCSLVDLFVHSSGPFFDWGGGGGGGLLQSPENPPGYGLVFYLVDLQFLV